MPSRSCVRAAIVCVVGLFAIGSCGEDGTDIGDTPNFSVMLRNMAPSGGPITILGPDEQTGTLGAALAPGAQRGYLVENNDCISCSAAFTASNAAGTNVGSVTCAYDRREPPGNAEVHWTGTALICIGWSACAAPSLGSAASSPSVNQPLAQCGLAATWRLNGIEGAASGTWSDISGTGTATLTFSLPQEVTAGQTYSITATLSGTFTAVPAWSGTRKNISVSICDRHPTASLCGLAATSAKLLERAELAATGTVSFTGQWTVTSSYGSTFTIEAAGGFDLPGTPLKLIATYTRSN